MHAQRAIALILLTALLSAACPAASEPAGNEDISPVVGPRFVRPVSYWTGEWDLRLGPIALGSGLDEAVAASASVYPLFSGKALLELWESSSTKGLGLRYYSRANDHWAIALRWTVGSQDKIATFNGHSADGRVRLYGRDADPTGQQRPFSDLTPFSLRWYDMMSAKAVPVSRGPWGMAFSRTAMGPGWPAAASTRSAISAELQCRAPEFRAYESILGHWAGTFDGKAASLSSSRVLGGCAVVVFVSFGSDPDPVRFLLLSYDSSRGVWTVDYLDDDRETGLVNFESADDWSITSAGDSRMRLHADGAYLSYQFTGANGITERGRFNRFASAIP